MRCAVAAALTVLFAMVLDIFAVVIVIVIPTGFTAVVGMRLVGDMIVSAAVREIRRRLETREQQAEYDHTKDQLNHRSISPHGRGNSKVALDRF